MSDVIEKVARAIHNSQWGHEFDDLPLNSIERALAIQTAEDAIAVIRQPSDEMRAFGYCHQYKENGWNCSYRVTNNMSIRDAMNTIMEGRFRDGWRPPEWWQFWKRYSSDYDLWLKLGKPDASAQERTETT